MTPRASFALALAVALGMLALVRPLSGVRAAPDWLDAINAIRASAGLTAVTENTDPNVGPTNDDAVAHSVYMVLNNTISHDEAPGSLGYTDGGVRAAQQGDVTVDIAAIDPLNALRGFIVSGYHWEPILDPSTTAVAFGVYTDLSQPGWKSASTLVFIKNGGAQIGAPVLWPPDGGQTPGQYLSRDPGENPDPMANCPNFPVTTGASITAQLTSPPQVTGVSLTMDGAVAPVTVCWFTAATVQFKPADIGVWDDLGRGILANQNVVDIFPQQPLADGVYHVTVFNDATTVCSWSFSVGQAPPPPDNNCTGGS